MTTKTRSVPISMEQLLLVGHPGELLPDEIEKVRAAAQWYVSDANHPESARQRVLEVWIEGHYRRAWDARSAPAPIEEEAVSAG